MGPTVRVITMKMDEALIARVDADATANGQGRSDWIRNACEVKLAVASGMATASPSPAAVKRARRRPDGRATQTPIATTPAPPRSTEHAAPPAPRKVVNQRPFKGSHFKPGKVKP